MLSKQVHYSTIIMLIVSIVTLTIGSPRATTLFPSISYKIIEYSNFFSFIGILSFAMTLHLMISVLTINIKN